MTGVVHVADCYLAQLCPGTYFVDGKPQPHRWTNEEQAWTPDVECQRCHRRCECARFVACEKRVREEEQEYLRACSLAATNGFATTLRQWVEWETRRLSRDVDAARAAAEVAYETGVKAMSQRWSHRVCTACYFAALDVDHPLCSDEDCGCGLCRETRVRRDERGTCIATLLAASLQPGRDRAALEDAARVIGFVPDDPITPSAGSGTPTVPDGAAC